MVNRVYYGRMDLIDRGAGVVTLEGEIKLPGGFRLPTRTTLLALASGGQLLLSPLPGLSAHKGEIGGHGAVTAIVAPSSLHHLGLVEAQAAFPGAPVFGPAGLTKKRPDVKELGVLEPAPHPLWAGDVEQLFIEGFKPAVVEVAFFHKASRTLVLTDLCFHINTHEHWPTRTLMKLNQAYERFGPSRIMRSQMSDRRRVKASVEKLVALGPERVVVAHGDVVEQDAARRLEEAFAAL